MRFDLFSTRVVQVVAAALAAVSLTQTDFWWLLRAGKDIWTTGRVPLTDHYSYTANGRPWTNHEWLWEAFAYAAHSVGGLPLVALTVAAAVYATLAVLVRLTPATGYVVPAVLVLALPPVSTAWTMRPQPTSFLLFVVTMLLLARDRYRLVPAVFLLWANLHAEVVIGGILLVCAATVAVVRWARSRSPDDLVRVRRLAVTTGASAIATLITPLGPALWTYVLGADGRPGQDAIHEWHNAFQVSPLTVWFWTAVAVTLVAAALRGHTRLREWPAQVCLAATVGMLPLAILAIRNIPVFMLAIAPLLMTLLELHPARPPGTVGRPRRLLVAVGAAAAASVVTVWALAPTALGWRPVPPVLASALRSCPGHVFTTYNTGAPLIWWVPEVKVFVDNRQDPYPAPIVSIGQNINGATYPTVFDEYDVRCALIEADSPLSLGLQTSGWTPVYRDQDVSFWEAPRATAASE